MKVRVKQGQRGFYGNKMRNEGDVFNLEKRIHSTKLGEDKKPLVIMPKDQFSPRWMEQVSKPGPKPQQSLGDSQ